MATLANVAHPARVTDVTTYDRILSAGAVIILLAAVTAIYRGQADWSQIPASVWLHLATVLTACALTPFMLLRRRGDRLHRQLGYVWAASMFLTAAISFDVRLIRNGSLSLIHILSAWTLIQVPRIIWTARQHQHARHRSAVRGMVLGALLIAGFFTFPFNRLLGNWLVG